MTQKINPFELALREIGALGMLEKNLPKSPDRSRYIERMFAIYAKFLGMSMEGIPREPESAADAVLVHFAEVLSTFDLEELRRRAIQLAKNQT